MKNLKIIRRRRISFSGESHGIISHVNGSLIVSNTTDTPVTIFDSDLAFLPKVHEERFKWPCEIVGSGKILSLQPMAGNSAELVIILESGEIMKRCEETVDLIGQIKDGIRAACWSPASDLLALVTGASHLILMTADFDVVYEGAIEGSSGDADGRFVSVGWGKKETQFHGTAGKEAAKAVRSVVMRPVVGDDGIPRIAWRGDGAYFAVSRPEETASGARRIRVFDRMGGLQAVSEPEEQLESSLAWIPNGSLIASTALHPNGTRQVIFFERNGLRHGEFNLPVKTGVKDMQWNRDSSVVALLFDDGSVGLWTRSNYHWYEKARIAGETCAISWNPSKDLQLNLLSKGQCELLDLQWVINRTNGDGNDKLSMVAVIDGTKVLLTPFAVANVPPPMGFGEFVLPGVPISIDMIALPNKPVFRMVVALEDSLIAFEGTVEGGIKMEQVAKIELNGCEQVVVESCERILVNLDGSVQVRSQSLELIEEIVCDRKIVISSCGTLLQSYSGEHRLIEDDWSPSSEFSPILFEFPSVGVIGMNESGVLYVNGEPVLSGCTSVFPSPEFLIVATVEKTLRFFPLSQDPSTWSHSAASGEESIRRIEAGSEIVTASSAACSLVLQAPRGNLETIYPRAMVLAGIRKALSALEYRKAYLDCRRHRIDLNFLYDAQPTTFMAMVDRFVSQVREADYLNLFISSLSPQDCTKTKYPGFAISSPTNDDEEVEQENKVNKVCAALRNVLSPEMVETIMTTFVCEQPPNLEAALRLTLTLSDPESMDRSLTYLMWLVNPTKLYDVALGLYHLPLALSIGRRSQKDPKEYVGFLEEMAELGESECRFRIDDRLGRGALALEGLWKCVQEGLMGEDDLLTYVQSKNLYKASLSLSGLPTDLHTRLLTQFATHCQSTGALEASATLFRLAKDFASAFEVCVEAGLWQPALSMATEIQLPQDDRLGLIGDLFESLMRDSRYAEAYGLACSDGLENEELVELALEAALAGNLWAEASRLSVPQRVLPKAVEVAESLITDLSDLRKTFSDQSTRLLLLICRLIDPPPTAQGITSGMTEISDTLSEMSFHSSASTRLTRSSTSSSRSRKKTERAKLRTKPGSPYERDGLRVALEQLIVKAHQIQSGIRPLLTLLSEHGSLPLASTLQSSLLTLITQMTSFSTTFRDLYSRLVNKMLTQANGPIVIGAEGITADGYTEEIANRAAWQNAFQLPLGFEIASNWSLPFL